MGPWKSRNQTPVTSNQKLRIMNYEPRTTPVRRSLSEGGNYELRTNLALSTSWNNNKGISGTELVTQIKELGIEQAELGMTLSRQKVEEIKELKEKGSIRVVSLHNYCPMPDSSETERMAGDSLASSDEEERKQAVFFTKRTIETAKSLGAGIVVLHAGKAIAEPKTRFLFDLYERGLKGTDRYEAFKAQMFEERRRNRDEHLDALFSSLRALSEFSLGLGIRLGIENRYHFREIPSLEELAIILDHFKDGNIFYWHDTGHAQVFENLGLAKHADYLETGKGRLAGVHLHDVVGVDDHLVPGKGNFDFRIIKPYLKKGTLKVIEAHPPATPEDIREGIKYLEGIGIE